ncbi:MAG: glycosyltransferase family 2 protein [Vicinamibacteraceae bacterium]
MTTVQQRTAGPRAAGSITVSAVMPTYNAAPYLKDAIDSVVSQTFSDWELIVVDDGSQDDTPAVLAAYRDPRIRVLRLPENRGRGAARNAGLAIATGRYVAVCDSDDISLPQRFARQVAFLDAHPEVDVVSGHMLVFWNGSTPRRSFRFPEDPAAISRRFQQGRMGVVHGASMLRARCFSALGHYRDELVRAEDFEYFRRIHRSCRFCTLPEVLLLYRHEVTRRPWWKWVENSRCHRYANYLCAVNGRPASAVMSFDTFGRRWQGYAADYSIELLKFAKFNALAYIRDLRIRATAMTTRARDTRSMS